MRRVLMISPHFPPDTSAAAHRVRLLAPYLPQHGWQPTVLTVTPESYETKLDPDLEQMVARELEVVRVPAWNPRRTRRFGLGDLGLRAYGALKKAAIDRLAKERFDCVFITLYPTYPAMLGPLLKRRFGVPFVLDYQDPWVGAWGSKVGGGPGGTPDLKSKIFRAAGVWLEPKAVRAADAITAVSTGTYEEIFERNPDARSKPTATIPLGGDQADFERLRQSPRVNPYFRRDDGNFHLCYVGTLLPLGFETLRAVLNGAAKLRERDPEMYGKLRIHFFGTSNQRAEDAPRRVMPVAMQIGVSDAVTEIAPRLDYLDALTVQVDASAILLLGSSERHYTASKLYPALLAKRPLLAVYHESSSVVEVLHAATQPPGVRVVTYNDEQRAESRSGELCQALAEMMKGEAVAPTVDMRQLEKYSAAYLAGQLAGVLERITVKC